MAAGGRLVSVTDYMPDGPPLAGFRLLSSKGIVGLAYRQRQTRVDLLTDPKYADAKEFQSYMVDRYAFTRDDAQQLPPDRRAYLASPVRTSGNIVLGVLFMEAARADAFADPDLPTRVEGLAPFFHEAPSIERGLKMSDSQLDAVEQRTTRREFKTVHKGDGSISFAKEAPVVKIVGRKTAVTKAASTGQFVAKKDRR